VRALSVLLAALAASLYSLSTSLQALEARGTSRETALRASLLRELVRRRRWVVGALAGLLAWPLQAVALAVGSLALVQPTLGFGLVALLVLGVTLLHEQVGARELGGTLAIVVAVAALAFAVPPGTGAFTSGGTWAVGLALIVIAPAPYLLRAVRRGGGLATSVIAGLGWAWTGFGTSLLDGAIADRHWLAVAGWGIGVGLATWGALLTEMTALQVWSATRAIPIAFGIEMLVPAALAPALTRTSPLHPVLFGAALAVAASGAVLLGGSRAVARAAQPITAP
jgi:hypothetical protein